MIADEIRSYSCIYWRRSALQARRDFTQVYLLA